MLTNICPISNICQIFLGGVLQRSTSEEIYRTLFCTAGKEKYETCKRYLASQRTSRPIPLNVMPNSSKSIEDIIEEIENFSKV